MMFYLSNVAIAVNISQPSVRIGGGLHALIHIYFLHGGSKSPKPLWDLRPLWAIVGGTVSLCTTSIAHNGHGHFLVKKSVESQLLVEWRTDVHCSVHVVRLTVDQSSSSICYPRTTLQTRSAKSSGQRSLFGPRWRPPEPWLSCRQSKPVLCHNVGKSSTPKHLLGSLAAC